MQGAIHTRRGNLVHETHLCHWCSVV